jgi:hypothetical protein
MQGTRKKLERVVFSEAREVAAHRQKAGLELRLFEGVLIMISISKESSMLLLKCLQAHNPSLVWVVESNETVNVDEKLGNELRESVGDEFMVNGLEIDSEPNSYGLELEALIDELGRLFMY